jgi:hypothetical protein
VIKLRTFYIFNISKELAILCKDNPYNLFKTLEGVYYLNEADLNYGMSLFESVAIPFHKTEINNEIYKTYKDNDFYSLKGYKHKIYNKYKDELTEIDIHSAFLLLKTNTNKKTVFQNLLFNNNLFVCDFKNKDYFWLDKLISYN